MTEEEAPPPPAAASTWTSNQWADYWRYQIGVNALPANTKDKKPLKGLGWEQWQNNPIPEELHNRWKDLAPRFWQEVQSRVKDRGTDSFREVL
jgi:hypothetical protein